MKYDLKLFHNLERDKEDLQYEYLDFHFYHRRYQTKRKKEKEEEEEMR